MNKLTLLVLLTLAPVARADIPNPDPASMPDVQCVGKEEGTACGVGGTCRKLRVRRPDFSKGAPTWQWTEVMVCEGSQGPSLSRALSALGAAALLAWWALRRGRKSALLPS